MLAITLVLIALLAVVLGGFVARATRVPLPFVLLALGMVLQLVSSVPVLLDPQLFFLLFLPPLLFLDGWRIPSDELAREAGSIARLALGLVLVTVLGMGAFIHLLLPVIPLPVALALAAVISPTDPTALSSIAARSPLPRRLLRVLQGEALFNDASGLVCMRVAVGVVLTRQFSLAAALGDFVLSAALGLAIGAGLTWAVARVMTWATRRLGDDGGAPVLVTLLLPFGVYLLAEQLHGSGILAAVAAGLTLSVNRLWYWRAETRLRRTAVWDVVHLAANGSIFVLLGGQLPSLLLASPRIARESGFDSPLWLVAAVLAIVAALGLLRLAWLWSMWTTSRQLRRWAGGTGTAEPVSLRLLLAATLGGVRGAVTLAGVLTLPLTLGDGTTFPARELVVLLAAGVIVVTLAVAALGLPSVLRGLPPEVDDPGLPPTGQAEDAARRAAAAAAIQAINAAAQALVDEGAHPQRSAELRDRVLLPYQQRIHRHDAPRPAHGRQVDEGMERRLRLAGLRAERAAVDALSRRGALDDHTLRALVRELDLQETRHRG